MKRRFTPSGRTLFLVAALLPLLVLFVWVAMRSGPLAPVPVTVAAVENRSIAPALYGIGTVEARYTYKIGPTSAGRVKAVGVQVGDRVRAGQLLGEMDPVDLEERVAALDAALLSAQSAEQAAGARAQEASARRTFADQQDRRYAQLLRAGAASEEEVETRRRERATAEAGLSAAEANRAAAGREVERLRAERDALVRQRINLRLLAPADGLVTARLADPGTTVVAGQAVVEMIDPASLWIHARFDQLRARGIRAGLPAQIVTRSHGGEILAGRVLRLEPLADAVTEESLAKVVFDALPDPLPPVGELAEVTVERPALEARPVVPNASLRRLDGRLGVWVVEADGARFKPVTVGETDLDGRVQISEGLQPGERVVVYSQRALAGGSRIKVVERLPGAVP